jgi:hypothetical protein
MFRVHLGNPPPVIFEETTKFLHRRNGITEKPGGGKPLCAAALRACFCGSFYRPFQHQAHPAFLDEVVGAVDAEDGIVFKAGVQTRVNQITDGLIPGGVLE